MDSGAGAAEDRKTRGRPEGVASGPNHRAGERQENVGRLRVLPRLRWEKAVSKPKQPLQVPY